MCVAVSPSPSYDTLKIAFSRSVLFSCHLGKDMNGSEMPQQDHLGHRTGSSITVFQIRNVRTPKEPLEGQNIALRHTLLLQVQVP